MDQYPPYQSAPQPQGNPYDFILNPVQPKRPKQRGFKGNFALTIALLIGGTIVLMVVTAIILNALAPKKISKDDLLALSQAQTELVRVSDQGASTARQQTTKDFATTIQATLLTQRKQTLDVLAKNGVKPEQKELALKQNASTDQKLTSAKATSTYDKAFADIMQTELTKYATTTKQLFEVAATKTERERMSDYYQQTQLLLSQIPYTQERIGAGSP